MRDGVLSSRIYVVRVYIHDERAQMYMYTYMQVKAVERDRDAVQREAVKQEKALIELRRQLAASAEKGRLLRLETELRDARQALSERAEAGTALENKIIELTGQLNTLKRSATKAQRSQGAGAGHGGGEGGGGGGAEIEVGACCRMRQVLLDKANTQLQQAAHKLVEMADEKRQLKLLLKEHEGRLHEQSALAAKYLTKVRELEEHMRLNVAESNKAVSKAVEEKDTVMQKYKVIYKVTQQISRENEKLAMENNNLSYELAHQLNKQLDQRNPLQAMAFARNEVDVIKQGEREGHILLSQHKEALKLVGDYELVIATMFKKMREGTLDDPCFRRDLLRCSFPPSLPPSFPTPLPPSCTLCSALSTTSTPDAFRNAASYPPAPTLSHGSQMEDFDSYIKEKGDIRSLAATRLTRLKDLKDDPEVEGAEKRPLAVSWLRWRRVELTGGELAGDEIVNAELSKALREGHTDFSQKEWEGFIPGTEERERLETRLTLNSYVKVGSLYYKPAAMDTPVLPWGTYTVRVDSCVYVCERESARARVHVCLYRRSVFWRRDVSCPYQDTQTFHTHAHNIMNTRARAKEGEREYTYTHTLTHSLTLQPVIDNVRKVVRHDTRQEEGTKYASNGVGWRGGESDSEDDEDDDNDDAGDSLSAYAAQQMKSMK